MAHGHAHFCQNCTRVWRESRVAAPSSSAALHESGLLQVLHEHRRLDHVAREVHLGLLVRNVHFRLALILRLGDATHAREKREAKVRIVHAQRGSQAA